MLSLCMAVLCSSLVSIVMRLSSNRVQHNLGMLTMNYIVCALLAGFFGGYQDALIALTGLSLQDQQNQQQQQQAAPVFNQSTQHTAGNMPTVSGKAIQWMGSATLNGNLLTG